MKKLFRSSKPYITVALLSFASLLLLPIMTSGCIPYFERNLTVCSYQWNWLGGFHVIEQKIHSLMGTPLEEWHNYLMYEIWALTMLIASAIVVGVAFYLLLIQWRRKKTTKPKKAKKNNDSDFIMPLMLILAVVAVNLAVYKNLYDEKYEEMRIIAPGEGVFVPGMGVVPSEINSSGPQNCINNVPESCILAPSVDLYPSPPESMQNPEYRPEEKSTMKEIGGILQSSLGNSITIKTTTDKLYTITFPLDVISWWNQNRAAEYNGYQLSNGEIITVMYLEPLTEHKTEIKASQIFSSHFAIEPRPKTDTSPIKRYTGPLE